VAFVTGDLVVRGAIEVPSRALLVAGEHAVDDFPRLLGCPPPPSEPEEQRRGHEHERDVLQAELATREVTRTGTSPS
jgi:hypothetical protein